MHLCVYLFVLWFPLVGQRGEFLRKRQIVQLTDRYIKSLFVAGYARQQDASLLLQVVLRKQLEDVVRHVKVTAFEQCAHSLLQVLDGAVLISSLHI